MIEHVIPATPLMYKPRFLASEHTQLSEPYLEYYIFIREHASGTTELEQVICLSPCLYDSGKNIGNVAPFICGAIRADGADARFLHTDTINELVRIGYGIFNKWVGAVDAIQQRELDRQEETATKVIAELNRTID